MCGGVFTLRSSIAGTAREASCLACGRASPPSFGTWAADRRTLRPSWRCSEPSSNLRRVTRFQRPPAWLVRFVALLAACLLVGQSLLGSFQLCGLAAALGADCCESPCIDEGPLVAAEEPKAEHAAPTLEVVQHTDGHCSCPLGCALGCCSPTRAVVQQAVMLERALGDSEQLPLSEVAETPLSPEVRGILHVPKRAA